MTTHKIFFMPQHKSKQFAAPELVCGTTLDMYAKMTPGRKGRWKNIQGTNDPEEADYFIQRDYTIADWQPPKDRLILIGYEPPAYSKGHKDNREMECAAHVHYAYDDVFFSDRWWNYLSYDELMALPCPPKPKRLSCIISKKEKMPGHQLRLKFLKQYMKRYRLDLYGSIIKLATFKKRALGTVEDKADAHRDYKYALSMENCVHKNLFTEKFADPLLLWAVPLYWGCPNIHDFFPEGSVVPFDVRNKTEAKRLNVVVESDFHTSNIKAIAEARQLLLNEYNYWNLIAQIINEGKVTWTKRS